MGGIEEVLYLVPDRISKRPATSICVTSYYSSFLWMLIIICLLIVNEHGNICIAEVSYGPYRISNYCISTYSNYCSFNAVYGVFFIVSPISNIIRLYHEKNPHLFHQTWPGLEVRLQHGYVNRTLESL